MRAARTALGSPLARIVVAGLAGGGAAQLVELAVKDPGLQAREAVVLVGALGLLGVPLAAGLALVGRVLAGPRADARGLPLALAAGAFLGVLPLAWFLGGSLPPLYLRTVTYGALPAALAAAAVVGLLARLWIARRGVLAGLGELVDAALPGVPLLLLAGGAALGLEDEGRGGAALAAWLGGALLALGAAAWAVRRPRAVAALGLVLFAAATAGAWWEPAPPVPPAARPAAAPGSVVWIVLDTVRADALGPWGGPRTPAVERLASEGVVFERVISPSPWTVPSHASMFTGLHPRSHGAWYGRHPYLDDGFETLAERYRAAGFETAAFYTNGWLRVANLLQGFETAVESVRRPRNKPALVGALAYLGVGPVPWIDKGSSETVDAVARWLAARDAQQPFLLFVNLFEAHAPFLPPRTWRALPGGVSELDAIRAHRGFDATRWHAAARQGGERPRAVRALYEAGVRFQDAMLGELLAAIETRVDLGDAVVVVTSDHGENLGEGGRWGHLFDVNEGLVHVPLVVRAPERLPAGARVAAPYQTLDLFAALPALSGLPVPDGEARPLALDGPGRTALFAETQPAWPLLGALTEADGTPRALEMTRPRAAVESSGRKLTVSEGVPPRLTRPAADPAEEDDHLAAEPERAAALAEALQAWHDAHPALPPGGEGSAPPAVSPEVQEMLRQLGYL